VPREKVQGAGSVAQMPRAERAFEEELVPQAESPEPSPAVVAPMPAAILRMQAAAGNRATSELLARAPDKGAVKEKPKPKSAATMSIPKMGDFPVLALVIPRTDRDDFDVTLSQEDGAKFQGPGLTANYPTITIKTGAVTITLTNAVITGYSLSGGTLGEDALVNIAFNAEKREFK
jgi:hypothetical protein